MSNLIAAALVFVLTHHIPAVKPVRAALVAALGEGLYILLYSLVSLGVLIWLFWAFLEAPYVELWPYQEWARWLALVVMVPACILLVAGSTTPNPLSVGWGTAGYDPSRPGIVSVTRHPVMWAFALWAAAHIPVNGEAAAVILFTLMLGLSLTGPKSLDVKRRAKLGEETWQRLAGPTSSVPFAAMGLWRAGAKNAWRQAPATLNQIGWGRLLGGAALYLVFLYGHPVLFGVSPMP